MRMTVEINDQLLQKAMVETGTKKKRQLIEQALQEVIRQRKIDRLIRRLGATPLTLTAQDLQRMRTDD
jgi:Arc/MetJ family transcription regulator